MSTLELLRDLKELVTLETKGNVKCATGIPPHIQNASVAKRFCQQDGGSDDVAMPFAEGEAENVSVCNMNTQQEVRVTYRNYSHHGKFWNVPRDFSFPTAVRLDTGWKMWICGLPGNETVDNSGNRQQAPIRPFRKLKLNMLPNEIKKNFNLHWRSIFSMMQAAPGVEVRETGIDYHYLRTSFDAAKGYLKTRVSYVFENERLHPERWGISTWSQKIERSSIVKDGTEQDKANLPPESNRNKSRRQHGHTKAQADRRRVRQHLNRTSRRARRQDNGDEGELPDLRDSLTSAAIARLQQIEAEVAAEEARAQQQQQLEGPIASALPNQTAQLSMLDPVSPCKTGIVP